MGSRDCFVGLSQANPERRVPMAQQCNHSVKGQRLGMFPSVAEAMAVVDSSSLRCSQCVRGRATRPSLRLNPC